MIHSNKTGMFCSNVTSENVQNKTQDFLILVEFSLPAPERISPGLELHFPRPFRGDWFTEQFRTFAVFFRLSLLVSLPPSTSTSPLLLSGFSPEPEGQKIPSPFCRCQDSHVVS